MSWISALAVYFVIWWLVLFAVLPFGVRTQEEEGEVILGTDRAAPAVPRMWWKLLATSLVAAVLFGAVYIAIAVFGVTLEDLVV
ncbi:DUF1467 family protein [Afifella marina]|uniref:Predicted secreted protein n=1 Tax=Afifella marina DSM 2698 TaxID=1120955 RepID=A0A1G5NKG3_AFIMA|nr:DUF1467 family protein [Afifella marina]MBK1623681.1 DUF1467 domain-containing protein [Afifella marina DSM 2698]MBK1626674.1 DUF1467 domain-containing protein [Afifella marina]MBK5916223.1 hypothetical protein [Afifella marina]RAI21583.1 hypothetical protein CH311_06075 [Afifella marina DSM 2698]SCZ37654.1 Predicted secreted protein [Afifella marina DSM 2698]